MEQILLKLIETSVSAAILIVVLYVFLPRLIRSIDALERATQHAERASAKEHSALTSLIFHLIQRLNWHEARVYGVNPSTGDSDDERLRAARESFNRAQEELAETEKRIIELFHDGDD